MNFTNDFEKRRTFAIVSHPDAGKTTMTEQLLLFGGAIQMAGTIKGKKSARHATSDWMELEKQRGISVTTSSMQFINKLDRESRDPMELLDEIERILNIKCAPITWPIGCGKLFKGVYHLRDDKIIVYDHAHKGDIDFIQIIDGIASAEFDALIGEDDAKRFRDEVALVKGASHAFNLEAYLKGEIAPVFFGSAVNAFGVREFLNDFTQYAPAPLARIANTRIVESSEEKFSGFV